MTKKKIMTEKKKKTKKKTKTMENHRRNFLKERPLRPLWKFWHWTAFVILAMFVVWSLLESLIKIASVESLQFSNFSYMTGKLILMSNISSFKLSWGGSWQNIYIYERYKIHTYVCPINISSISKLHYQVHTFKHIESTIQCLN